MKRIKDILSKDVYKISFVVTPKCKDCTPLEAKLYKERKSCIGCYKT